MTGLSQWAAIGGAYLGDIIRNDPLLLTVCLVTFFVIMVTILFYDDRAMLYLQNSEVKNEIACS